MSHDALPLRRPHHLYRLKQNKEAFLESCKYGDTSYIVEKRRKKIRHISEDIQVSMNPVRSAFVNVLCLCKRDYTKNYNTVCLGAFINLIYRNTGLKVGDNRIFTERSITKPQVWLYSWRVRPSLTNQARVLRSDIQTLEPNLTLPAHTLQLTLTHLGPTLEPRLMSPILTLQRNISQQVPLRCITVLVLST
jgi:hypothetical protein